jgi:hypothetical protein
MDEKQPSAPGLRWRKRADGRLVPYWLPDDEARKAGFPTKSVNLALVADAPTMLVERCVRLQAEMRAWLANERSYNPVFDGKFGSLLDRYLRDPESSYRALRNPHNYTIYAKKLQKHVGDVLIDDADGLDVQKWFRTWAGVDDLRDPRAKLPRARFMLSVLKAANSFGILCKYRPCREFAAILAELEFPRSRRRAFAPTAAQIESARKAAHEAGAPSRALVYALQYETGLRQWDVIGQWLPLSDRRPSTLIDRGEKWIGTTWAHVDDSMILRVTPTKTEDTTAAAVMYDLTACPMVMEELNLVVGLNDTKSGPLIVDERSGLPYRYTDFLAGWRKDFKAAGLPPKMWNRDLRAGASTEASAAGVSREDRAKLAGHSEEIQAQVYDRDTVETHRRAMQARKGFRERKQS